MYGPYTPHVKKSNPNFISGALYHDDLGSVRQQILLADLLHKFFSKS